MKPDKREEARRLRREEGMTITEICRVLSVSKSSVSVWVRDIALTDAQQAKLHEQHNAYRAQAKGGHTNAVKARELRKQYQEEGRTKAREKDPLHIAGCMLYWAEGRKNRHALALVNSDADLLTFYVQFLRNELHVTNSEITIYINCYLGNGLTQHEIESFWLDTLELPAECLRKTMVNNQPKSSQHKGRKLLYGVCGIHINRTQLVQHVLGAIQEYIGIEKPEWLM